MTSPTNGIHIALNPISLLAHGLVNEQPLTTEAVCLSVTVYGGSFPLVIQPQLIHGQTCPNFADPFTTSKSCGHVFADNGCKQFNGAAGH